MARRDFVVLTGTEHKTLEIVDLVPVEIQEPQKQLGQIIAFEVLQLLVHRGLLDLEVEHHHQDNLDVIQKLVFVFVDHLFDQDHQWS